MLFYFLYQTSTKKSDYKKYTALYLREPRVVVSSVDADREELDGLLVVLEVEELRVEVLL